MLTPMPFSQFASRHLDISLNVWERAGLGLPLLFAHATSFHGRIWSEVIERLPERQCYAPDLRGHGLSDGQQPPANWRDFGTDLAALARALGLRGALGIGHSMGGHSIALAAALAPECIAALLLIDPTIQPRTAYNVQQLPEHFAARRRSKWASPEEMFARFVDRLPFSRWDPAVLRDYCTYGLVPAPDGEGFVLACAPGFEASIYQTSLSTDIYEEIATVSIPVHIVRSGALRPLEAFDMSASASSPTLARSFSRAFDVHLPGYSHFLPMENPAWVAAYLTGLADTLGS